MVRGDSQPTGSDGAQRVASKICIYVCIVLLSIHRLSSAHARADLVTRITPYLSAGRMSPVVVVTDAGRPL